MTARGAPWSDFELQCLYEVINDVDWFDQVAHRLPGRTTGAIRTKMSMLRSEAGITIYAGTMRSSWADQVTRARAAHGSDSLVRAIRSAAAQLPPDLPREEIQLDFLPGPLFDWADSRCDRIAA